MAPAAPAVSRTVTSSNFSPSEAPRGGVPAALDGRTRDTGPDTASERAAIDVLEPKWADAVDAATD